MVAFLEHVEDEDFLDELADLAGGREARDAIQAYLDRYGIPEASPARQSTQGARGGRGAAAGRGAQAP